MDEPVGPQGVGVDVVTLEVLQGVEVDHRIFDPERVLEALELRDPSGERHLASLEADGHRAARPLTLHAPTGCLAALAGDAAADSPSRLGRPLRRLQIVQLHLETSSTVMR